MPKSSTRWILTEAIRWGVERRIIHEVLERPSDRPPEELSLYLLAASSKELRGKIDVRLLERYLADTSPLQEFRSSNGKLTGNYEIRDCAFYALVVTAEHDLQEYDFGPAQAQPNDTFADTYDGAGQLIETDHTGTYQADDEGYEFDLNGNRLDVTGGGGGTSTYVIGPNNEILDDGVYTYTYDKEGNRLTKFRKTPTSTYDDYTFYTYDHRNRLVDVSFYDGDDPENDTLLIQRVYRYDYLDRRVSVTNPLDSSMASQQRYAYDGHDIVLECVGLNSGWFFYTMGYNFWVPDGENSLLISNEVYVGYMLRPSLIHWTFSDAQQTTTDIVQSNDEGTEFHRLNHIVYDSAGNTVATWRHTYGWGGPTDHLFTRYLKDGNERDWLTGLYLTDGRPYDPTHNAFTQPDKIGFLGLQWNLYIGTWNDPVNYTDRSGRAGDLLQEIPAGNGMTLILPNVSEMQRRQQNAAFERLMQQRILDDFNHAKDHVKKQKLAHDYLQAGGSPCDLQFYGTIARQDPASYQKEYLERQEKMRSAELEEKKKAAKILYDKNFGTDEEQERNRKRHSGWLNRIETNAYAAKSAQDLVETGPTVYKNSREAGHSVPGSLYNAIGTVIGTVVGVRGVSDFFSRNDAVDGHRQSWTERAIDGFTGGASLGFTGTSLASPFLRGSATICPPRSSTQSYGLPDDLVAEMRRLEQLWPEAQSQLAKSGQPLMMPISRKQALNRVEGLEGIVLDHLDNHIPTYIGKSPQDIPHWRSEVGGFLNEMERLSQYTGKKTSADIANRIAEMRRRLTQLLGDD
jgi:RHS repeat-associated protein